MSTETGISATFVMDKGMDKVKSFTNGHRVASARLAIMENGRRIESMEEEESISVQRDQTLITPLLFVFMMGSSRMDGEMDLVY